MAAVTPGRAFHDCRDWGEPALASMPVKRSGASSRVIGVRAQHAASMTLLQTFPEEVECDSLSHT